MLSLAHTFTHPLSTKSGQGQNIKSFYSEFNYPATPIWHSTSQGDCVTALSFDMIPASKRAYVLTNMFITGTNIVGRPGYWGISNYNSHCSDISKSSNHLSTGYALTVRAMLELTRGGFTTNAYQLLTTGEFPSWLYSVTNGFTTCWEGWNTYVSGANTPQSGGRGYNTAYGDALCSFNHLPFGAVGEWIWKVVGGINPDDNHPGFQNVTIKPEPGGGITNTFASFLSIHGPVVCVWTNTSPSSAFSLNVAVPANTTADIYIPSTNNLASITENGGPSTTAPGVFSYYFTNPPSYTKGATVFRVGSGVYKFVLSN